MAAVGCVLSEDHLLCSICLEVYTDPVTTPCGHNFCTTCIHKHWDSNPRPDCPVCKDHFSCRPHMRTNTCLSEMAKQFRTRTEDVLVSNTQLIFCDICSKPKLKALKSCLICLLSYCENHLEPHLTIPHLKKHHMIQAQNLEDRICPLHERPLELYCRDDLQFLCVQCLGGGHKNHKAVPLKDECAARRAEMDKMAIIIQERREKMEEIWRLVEVSQKNAKQELKDGLRVFEDMIKCIEQSMEKFRVSIEKRQKETEEEAEEVMEKIQTELSFLEKMDQLLKSEDHFHILQNFTEVKPTDSKQDWAKVTVKIPSYKGTVARAVSNLHNSHLYPKMKNVFGPDLTRLQGYAVEVTLDPETAHNNLVLSKNLKEVHHTNQTKDLPDTPDRFSQRLYVLGKQKFSSGRFYFEVQVKGKTSWLVGVAKDSVNRKVKNDLIEDGYWYIYKTADQYQTSSSLEVQIRSSPDKVGVFLDYGEGVVSFYDVISAEMIHSFINCSFTDDIRPLFNPCGNNTGKNSTPLKLTPVPVMTTTQ